MTTISERYKILDYDELTSTVFFHYVSVVALWLDYNWEFSKWIVYKKHTEQFIKTWYLHRLKYILN
jgi:hypothetical protein